MSRQTSLLIACLTIAGCEGREQQRGRRPPPDSTSTSTSAPASSTSPPDTVDTDQPPCAGVPGDTGLLLDVSIPTEPCPYAEPPPRGTPGTSVLADEIAMARVLGNKGRMLGFAVAPLGDPDGDGFADVALGGPGYDDFYGGVHDDGEVWIVRGPVSGDVYRTEMHAVLTPPDLGGSYAGSQHGWFLAIGDLTGDGQRDLVVAGAGYTPISVVTLPVPPGVISLDTVAAALLEPQGGDSLNHPAIGDVDGDGVGDLSLVDFTGAGRTQFGPTSNGGALALLGPLSGIYEDPVEEAWAMWETVDLDEERFTLGTGTTSGSWGPGLIPDVTGDGIADVLLGGDAMADIRPSVSETDIWRHGGAVLFEGGTAGRHSADDARAILYGACDGLATYVFPVGDVSGDCRPDLAVGADRFSVDGQRGAVYLVTGLHRARGLVPLEDVSSAVILGENRGDLLGHAGYVGDLDGDGFAELAVGARFAGPEYKGAVYLFFGPVEGLLSASDADIAIYGSGVAGMFGSVIQTANDMDGDKVPDLMVGAYGAMPPNAGFYDKNGMVYIFSGTDLVALRP